MLNVSKLLKMASIATGAMIITVSVFGDWWCNRCNRNHRDRQTCPYARLENPYNFDCNDDFGDMSDDEDMVLSCMRMQLRQMERNNRIAHERRNASRLDKLRELVYQLKDREALQQALDILRYRIQNLGFDIRNNDQVFNPCDGYDPYDCNEMNRYGYNCHNDYGYYCGSYGCDW